MGNRPNDDVAKGSQHAGASKKPSPYSTASYEVGKGKPPAKHQFKQGNKGGPGRPKGSRNRGSHDGLLDERVKVGEDRLGRAIYKTYRELINRQLLNKAAKGEISAIKIVKEFEFKHGELDRKYGSARRTDEEIAKAERLKIESEQIAKQAGDKFSDILALCANLKKWGLIETVNGRFRLVQDIQKIMDNILRHRRGTQ